MAIVLAGGRGTRLGDLTKKCAKPALSFGGDHRIIDYSLSNCAHSGIRRTAVLTQFEGRGLIRHIQRCWGSNAASAGSVEFWPAQQDSNDSWYAGTADAVRQNLDEILETDARYVLILAGDHVYSMDYRAMLDAHRESRAAITIASSEVPLCEARRFGVLRVDGAGRVLDFAEKPDTPAQIPDMRDYACISMGIYVFDKAALVDMLGTSFAQAADFGRDLVPPLVSSGAAHVYRFVDAAGQPCFWRDVGTIDAYYGAQMELLEPDVAASLFRPDWPIIGDLGSLPARLEADHDGNEAVASNSILGRGCRLSGARVRQSIVSRDVTIRSGSIVERSVLLPGADVGQDCWIRDAVVEAGCRIPDNTVADDLRERAERTSSGAMLITQRALQDSAAASPPGSAGSGSVPRRRRVGEPTYPSRVLGSALGSAG